MALFRFVAPKRRRTQSSPSSPDSSAARVREGPSPALSPAPLSHEPSIPRLPYLRSDLSYLNVPSPDTIDQLDGADDADLELRPVAPPPPPAPPPASLCPPAVRFKKKHTGDIFSIGCTGEWVRARGGDFAQGYFSHFKDFPDC